MRSLGLIYHVLVPRHETVRQLTSSKTIARLPSMLAAADVSMQGDSNILWFIW